MKSGLQDNDIETYSTHYEGKSVVPERIFFIRTLKDKIYKYMTSVSKNIYINKLDVIVSNTYRSTIKIMSTDVKSSTRLNLRLVTM